MVCRLANGLSRAPLVSSPPPPQTSSGSSLQPPASSNVRASVFHSLSTSTCTTVSLNPFISRAANLSLSPPPPLDLQQCLNKFPHSLPAVLASAFGLYKYSIQGVTEWPDYSVTLLGFNSLSVPSLVTYVGCLAHKIRSDKTLFPSRLIDLLQICLKPRFQTTLLLNAAVLFCRVVVCLCRFCFYWKDEGVPTSTKGLNKDWVDGNWFCKATVCLLLIFSEKKKEHCVPAAIFCLVIGDKSQIRRCAIPRFNFGWQLRCQFQLFPRMPLPDTKGKQVSHYFQAVIVISLKPLNHFLCHIIVKASVSFKTKCRTASPCCRCVRQFYNFPKTTQSDDHFSRCWGRYEDEWE